MEPFIGQVIMFAGNFAPRGWAFCDGQLLQISSNSALFSILGTTYGGDGRTTFGLPDLRGRAPIHEGTGPGLQPMQLGSKGGAQTTTLNVANLPAHSHVITMKGSGETGEKDDPSGNAFGAAEIYTDQAPAESMKAGMITAANTGANQPFNNYQPYQVLNYIIALIGTYPSRS